MRLYDDTPQLDLSPSFTQPLSASNGRDYLTLLHWIFLFPQALDDYVQLFLYGKRQEKPPPTNWQLSKWQQWFRRNPAQIQLLWMALILASACLLVVEGLYAVLQLGRQASDLILDSVLVGSSIGLATMLALSFSALLWGRLAGGIAMAVAHSITLALWITLSLGYTYASHSLGMIDGIVYGLLCGLAFGMTYAIFFTFFDDSRNIPTLSMLAMLVIGLLLGVSILAINHAKQGETVWQVGRADLIVAGSGALASFGGVLCGLAYPLDWLLIFFNPLVEPTQSGPWRAPHITWWPVPPLRTYLETWLARNWSIGLANADQLWRYTRQHTLIKESVQQVLSESSGDATVEKVATFAKKAAVKAYVWEMILFSPVPIQSAGQPTTAGGWSTRRLGSAQTTPPVKAQDQRKQRRIEQTISALGQTPITYNLPLDTAAKAVVAGFYYLHRYHPHKAAEAFKQVAATSYGKELYDIAQAFATLFDSENLVREPLIKLPSPPDQPWHAETWKVFGHLRDVVRYGWLYAQSNDPIHKQLALDTVNNRLDAILNQQALPETERDLIQALAAQFRLQVNQWPTLTLSRTPLKPGPNPFSFSSPLLERKLLFGRNGELGALKRVWSAGRVQPVLLFGQPQMGKTSLLRSAATANRTTVLLALVNLREIVGGYDASKQILTLLCQEIADGMGDSSPFARELDSDPFPTVAAYLRKTCARLGNLTLVIGIDSFELTSVLFPSHLMREHLMEFFWQLFESIPNLGFVFITNTPAKDFDRKYTNPFVHGVRTIRVSYLKKEDTVRLLLAPDANFAPLHTADALDYIYNLTAGQPYLVQLIGHFGVHHYTTQVAQNQSPLTQPDPILTVAHVNLALQDPEFGRLSTRYFANLMRQVQQSEPESERVLRCLAAKPDGLREGSLRRQLGAGSIQTRLNDLLEYLRDYDVIQLDPVNHRWQVRVELFRTWLA